MKAHYKLVITPRTGVRTVNGAVAPVVLEFRGTTWQANKAFLTLCYALHESNYKQLDLFVMPAKSETGHKVNGCKLGGAERGL